MRSNDSLGLYDPHFHWEAGEYKRDLDMMGHYVSQAGLYLSTMTGKPREVCEEYVRRQVQADGRFPIHDPKVMITVREKNGDRRSAQANMSKYLEAAVGREALISPTFTTYVSPKLEVSNLSRYIEGNIVKRGMAKKAMFKAEADEDHLLYAIKKVEQKGRKLGNNGVSGTHCTPSTPLYNPSAHATLTSTCRTTSGYGNANNEKFLAGNRHYFNRDIVINNIVSICDNVNYNDLEYVVKRYQFHVPTADEVMGVIEYSARLYFWNSEWFSNIRSLVDRLTDLQRCAFVYVGDAYHLSKFNRGFMDAFLNRLSARIEAEHPQAEDVLKKAPDNYLNLAHQICFTEMVGISPRNYKEIAGTPKWHTLASTVENIAKTIHDHYDLIQTLWMTDNIPASVSHFPSSVRRTALTSDTDSTIFTVQDWVDEFGDGKPFSQKSRSIFATVVFLTSSTIRHVLAIMSANFGIAEEKRFKISMKSEFSFDIFTPTQLGKHYFAAISCQEGLVKKEIEYEIKGAQLKSANAPRFIIKGATEMMKDIIHAVSAGEKISLRKWLNHVADVENTIVNTIKADGMDYFRSITLKSKDSYSKGPEDSPYANHTLWQEVFAPKYGNMPEPPYRSYKINVSTTNPTKFANWLEKMEDQELAARMREYARRKGKKSIAVFNLPADILATGGIPAEIKEVIDYERIVRDICKIYYLLLECLGYYALGKRVRRLVSQEGWGTQTTIEVAEEDKVFNYDPEIEEEDDEEVAEE